MRRLHSATGLENNPSERRTHTRGPTLPAYAVRWHTRGAIVSQGPERNIFNLPPRQLVSVSRKRCQVNFRYFQNRNVTFPVPRDFRATAAPDLVEEIPPEVEGPER